MSDSWNVFLGVLREECAAFANLNAKAIAFSNALVENASEGITRAQEDVDAARTAYVAVFGRRRGMQQRGFGGISLRSVCAYAPPHLSGELTQRAAEIVYHATSLQIINSNNKALVLGGMERLIKTVAVIQRAQASPLTYKRRGIVPPAESSLIMSKKA